MADVLAPWGQAAAMVLALYLFISILIGLALAAALMLGLAWIREKSELLKLLRPRVTELNQAFSAAKKGEQLPAAVADNNVIATTVRLPQQVTQVSHKADGIEQRIEQSSERVANAVIEFHARTAMFKGMARAFFLPGLTRGRPSIPVAQPAPPVIQPEREQEQVVTAADHPTEPPLEQEIVIRQSSR